MIPGDWVAAREPNAYRSRDGRAFAGVLFWLPRDLEGVEGEALVERAKNLITQVHEKALKQRMTGVRMTGVELMPFESARPGAWKWTVGPLVQGEEEITFPTKIIVDLSPNAVVQISVSGTSDDDNLARRVIESLRTTSDPGCYWQLLEDLLKSPLGDR